MGLLVQKFGGTSLATPERIQRAALRVTKEKEKGHRLVVVVSAMGEETDALLALADHFKLPDYSREHDMLLATGEQKSMALLAIALIKLGCKARSLTAAQAGIHASGAYGYARIVDIEIQKIMLPLDQGDVVVIAGFQGMMGEELTTLGRGGSDLTAVALAAALKADECQIFTDVEGVHFADPRLVPIAHKLDTINFKEMLALSHLGAKVLHHRAVLLAKKMQVPLRVLSSFVEGKGTVVAEECPEDSGVMGIACQDQQVLVRLSFRQDDGILSAITGYLARIHIMISSMGYRENEQIELVFVIPKETWSHAHPALLVLLGSTEHAITVREPLAQISIIGKGIHLSADIREKFHQVLRECGANILYSTGSEVALSALTDIAHLSVVMEELYQVFHFKSI